MAINEMKTGTPSRQGYYRVVTLTGEKLIGDWRDSEDSPVKRWWTFVSDEPTLEKRRVPLEGVAGYCKATDSEVERFLKRELTRDEKIVETYRQYKQNISLYPQVRRAVPENRRLAVGQEVLVGSLTDAKVAGVFDDGEVLVLEHQTVKVRGDAPGKTFGAWHWIAVLPKTEQAPAGLAYSPSYTVQTYLNTPVGALIRRVYSEGVKDDTDYQRGYAWTADDKARFLESVFAGRPMGSFIFVKHSNGAADEVLDGKQRMNTLLELVMSALPYRGVYWHQMSAADRNTVMQRPAQFAELSDEQYTEADFYDIFLDVNAAGVPQTEEHLTLVPAKRDALRAAEVVELSSADPQESRHVK